METRQIKVTNCEECVFNDDNYQCRIEDDGNAYIDGDDLCRDDRVSEHCPLRKVNKVIVMLDSS